MPPVTRYSAYLGDRDPLETMRVNVGRIRSLVDGWSAEQFERTYAAGKWTALQILAHLAHTEMALGTRARMALSTPDYAAQSFDQDDWMKRETRVSGREALAAFVAMSHMNAALFDGLSQAERQITMSHPEFGAISVDWILHLLPGHQLHHLEQLQAIARTS